jgi:NAD(P)-dependent dehydrogenase (short-subunit alcohol dehydrogenase family)
MEDPATADQWQAYIDTHLNGPFWLSQAVIPYMKAQNPKFAGKGEKIQEGIDRTTDLKRHEEFKHLPDDLNGKDRLDKGGSIIHISSFRAHQSDPDCEGYGATKAGLIGLTQAMSVSCQRWGIRVNVISPGWISVPHECREGDEKVGAVQGAPHGEEAMDARAKLWAKSVCERDHIQHTAGRVGIGEDVAEAVEYLMGAGFMNGHVSALAMLQ